MTKKLLLLNFLFAFTATLSSYAQSSASATQTIHLQVAPVIEIGNGNNGKGNGNIGNQGNHGNHGNHGNGNNGNHGNGNNGNGNGNKVAGNNTGNGHSFNVNSNKEFIVNVQSLNTEENILLALADNNTGGSANPAFNQHYSPVGATAQDLLMNCSLGHKKTFSVNYKTKNNNTKQQGLTKADIIYTATLP